MADATRDSTALGIGPRFELRVIGTCSTGEGQVRFEHS